MSKNELLEFSQMPNIDMARAQLCAVLESAGSSIVSQLNQSQQILVSHLEKHVELQSKPIEATKLTENTEPIDSKES